jgi:hypothetical protein
VGPPGPSGDTGLSPAALKMILERLDALENATRNKS